MKKLHILFLSLALIVLLAGCDQPATETNTTPVDTTMEQNEVVTEQEEMMLEEEGMVSEQDTMTEDEDPMVDGEVDLETNL